MSTRGGNDSGPLKTALKNRIKHLLSFPYHLCRSADLHGNIASRVADADHQHPQAPVSLRISVLPAVGAFSRKALVSWRVGGEGYRWKRIPPGGKHFSELTNLESPTAVGTGR